MFSDIETREAQAAHYGTGSQRGFAQGEESRQWEVIEKLVLNDLSENLWEVIEKLVLNDFSENLGKQ